MNNSEINVRSETPPVYTSNISSERQIKAVEFNIGQKPNKKESAINQSTTKPLTLGFLSSNNDTKQRPQQQQTYGGLKEGLLD